MERKTRLMGRGRPFRGLALALFALFGGLATAAQAMLLTLDLRWDATAFDPDTGVASAPYNLQVGSIIQVIGFKGGSVSGLVDDQFVKYGETTDDKTRAEPYGPGDAITHVPSYGEHGDNRVFLADTTQDGHEILYTGSIQDKGSFYGLYTQITVDQYLYDTVYIRVFGATEFKQGEMVASYWGLSDPKTLDPDTHFYTDTLSTHNVEADKANYFEVIPEPATVGLLGVGGVALAAWRRRRVAKADGGLVCEED